MESLSVRVRNPFALRESLQVALEVAWPDLSPEQVTRLRQFTGQIPAQVGPTALSITPELKASLQACAAYFRQTRTWYWLREDLCEAFTEMERELSSKSA